MSSLPAPLVLPYDGIEPRFATSLASCGVGAAVLGRVTIGRSASLGAYAVIRADGHYVKIGDDFWIGDRSTVHIAHDMYPTVIGDRVTVGSNSVVHACTVGDDCVIGDNTVVLDGSTVEDGVVIEPGSLIFPRTHLRRGYLYAGSPALPIRPIAPGEAARHAARMRVTSAQEQPVPESGSEQVQLEIAPSVFIGHTAHVRGPLRAEPNSSIWYGCDLDANQGAIVIGRNTNVQDNTRAHCSAGGHIVIGSETTIGHNVQLHDCAIGNRALVGIGSLVERGAVLEDDVLLAAGATVAAGQRLEAGWLWGGRPARRMSKLDGTKQEMIASIARTYCRYALSYKHVQSGADVLTKASVAPEELTRTRNCTGIGR